MRAGLTGVNLLWEDLKHRSWLLVLAAAGALVLLPFRLQMELSTLTYGVDTTLPDAAWLRSAEIDAAREVLGGGSFLLLAGIAAAAVISAFTGFAYLYSRRQVDFYHSLPVRREKLFLFRYLGGFLMVAVPYLFSLAAALFGVAGTYGIWDRSLSVAAAEAAGFFLLLFLLFYSLAVLAVLLTGRILTGLLLTAFFYLYGGLCRGMLRGMMSQYFDTYYGMGQGELPLQLPLFAPFFQAERMRRVFASGELLPVSAWILTGLSAAAALLLCVLLYRKRPSEACGNAFGYRWMEAVIKVAVTIPCSLWTANLLQQMGYLREPAMALAAAGLTALILVGIFEFLYSQDLRNVWRHKLSSLLPLGGTLLILLAFWQDWFGYDRWMPEESRIESMALYSSESEGIFTDGYWNIREAEEKILEQSLTEAFDPIYQLVKNRDGDAGEDVSTSASDWQTYVAVHFRMRNGRNVYRQYTVSISELEAALCALTEEQTYRETFYPVSSRNIKNVTDIAFSDWNDYSGTSESLMLDGEERAELLRIFREETESFSYRELKEMDPVGVLRLGCYRDRPGPYESSDIGYYLYPAFEDTINYLKRRGIRLQSRPDLSQIVSVQADYMREVRLPDDEATVGTAVSELYAFTTKEAVDALFDQLKRVREAEYLASGEYVSLQIVFSDGTYSNMNFAVKDQKKFRDFLDRYGASARTA